MKSLKRVRELRDLLSERKLIVLELLGCEDFVVVDGEVDASEEFYKQTYAYLDYLEEHISNVRKAWDIVQEKCSDLEFVKLQTLRSKIEKDVIDHDLSKFSFLEFVPYRRKFYGLDSEEEDITSQFWEIAVQHHYDKNDHHWQTWNTYEDHYEKVACCVHMVVDWFAMSIKFGEGSPRGFYMKEKDIIEIPPWAEDLVLSIFERIES